MNIFPDPAEVARGIAEIAANAQRANHANLTAKAAGALAVNDAFIQAAAAVTFPLSVGAQQALVGHVVALTKGNNAILRLLVGLTSDLSDT